MQTYIDCVHVKKSDRGRLQTEDPMEMDKENDMYAGYHESDTSEAANEAKVPDMSWSLTLFLYSVVLSRFVF